ncbi:TonB family protein [Pyxidicoccus fallax]|uniref:TonB family protein n=1 Tax=Pyxidicoccus fallax TaxID=394095 RepID=A0A848LUE9_9BACT|nr:TonB family protein [Pyxidicoccus fallax]NMO21658.1 TonB family protein [Pyxidicoccus fallax]NPC85705.1 TonB family protein [Pyxidicoccus fallax]
MLLPAMSPNVKARSALAAASLLLAGPALAQAPQADAAQPEAAAPAQAQPTITKPPELLQQVEAQYPPEALTQGLTASVRLIITIAEDGTVSDVQPTEAVGNGFDEAAIAAVRQFRFSPAEVDGVSAPVQVEYVYHFTLNAPPPAEGAQAEEQEAPKATLTGQLISRGSRSRVAGATVRCGDDPDAPEALSDADGRFTLQVPPGECAVRVVASGYQLYQTKEQLKPNETTEVNFYLAPSGGALETVVRSERPKKEVVRRTITRQEAQKTPGTFGDPIRVIQALPGVARAPFISGELLVRGSNPGQTATMMDGVRIPILFHLLGGPSVVNAEFIDQLDFYPGGYGSQYGRAVGGIVEVGTRKGAADTLHGSVKIDLMDAGFFLETPITDGISVAAAARRSYIDTLLPAFLPKDEGSTLSVVPRYWDYQLRVDFGAKRGAASEAEAQEQAGGARSSGYVMAFGSDDQLRVVSSGPKVATDIELDTRTTFHRVKGDWTYRKGALTSVFTPYVGLDNSSFDFGAARQDGRQYSVGAREVLGMELSPMLTLRTGLDLVYEYEEYDVEFPAPEDLEYVAFPGAESVGEMLKESISLDAFDGALFLEADVKVGKFTFTPGVRGNLQLVDDTRNLALDPRLWVRYAATERTSLKGSVGLYSQAPETFRFVIEPYGTPDLVYQRAFQTSLGVEHRFTDALDVDLTGFFNRRFKNIVEPGQIIQREGGTFFQERYSNDGIGRAFGVELMVKKNRASAQDKWSGWLSYTLSRALDGRAGPKPARDGGFGGGFLDDQDATFGLSPWDQTHILTLVGNYILGNGWELGGRFRYTTGRPASPLNHTYDVYNSERNGYSPTYGPFFSSRTDGFHQLDVRVEKSWQFQSWTLATYLDVQNIYNASNAEFLTNDYRYRKEYEVPGIPILPVLGVKGSF